MSYISSFYAVHTGTDGNALLNFGIIYEGSLDKLQILYRKGSNNTDYDDDDFLRFIKDTDKASLKEESHRDGQILL